MKENGANRQDSNQYYVNYVSIMNHKKSKRVQ